MGQGRSDLAFGHWKESSEKFDYFITGVTAALTGYVGQQFHPVRIGLNPGSLELTALAVLVISAVLGFKRIEASVTVYRLVHERLGAEAAHAGLLEATKGGLGHIVNISTGQVRSPAEVTAELQRLQQRFARLEAASEKVAKRSGTFYTARNWTLLGGFALLVAARVLQAYR